MKRKKTLLVLLALIIMVGGVFNSSLSFAKEENKGLIDTKNQQIKAQAKSYKSKRVNIFPEIYYQKDKVWGSANYKYINDRLVFCVEPEIGFKSDQWYENMPASDYSRIIKNRAEMEKWVHFGYTLSKKEDLDYVFTQIALWEIMGYKDFSISKKELGGRDLNPQYEKWKAGIKKKVDLFHAVPAINGKSYDIKLNESLTIKDDSKKGILNESRLSKKIDGLDFSFYPNKIEVKMTKPIFEATTCLILKNPQGYDKAKGTSIVFKSKTNQDVAEFKLGNDPVKYKIKLNPIIKGKIQIKKEDQDQNPVAKVGFRIYDESMNSLKFKLVGPYSYRQDPDGDRDIVYSSGQGISKISNLDFGSYTIREEIVPKGYELDKKDTKVELSKDLDDFTKQVTIVNKKLAEVGNIELVKVDLEDEKPLGQAEFKIYDSSGKILSFSNIDDSIYQLDPDGQYQTLTTAEDGRLDLRDLPFADYTIKETRAPQGYQILEEEIKVSLTRQSPKLIEKVTVGNRKKPQIKTNASGEDKEKDLEVSDQVKIIDRVEYENLIVGKDYKLSGQLIDKETGKPLLVHGEVVRAEKTFTADKSSGVESLEFIFDGSSLRGKEIVVFEDLYQQGKKIASHADIEDKDQTVRITNPSIATEAFDISDGEKDLAKGQEQVIVDRVSYRDLIVGKDYLLRGSLVDKNGNTISLAEKQFTAESRDGHIDMEFRLDSSKLGAIDLVVFEKLYSKDYLLASHEDINDYNQTIKLAEIKTTAVSPDQRKEVLPLERVQIVDRVSYSNLLVGQEYRLTGLLMDKNENKALVIEGKEVRSEISFIAEESSGFVEVSFDLDASDLMGKDLVVFEDLYRGDKKLASHADLNDLDQTIRVLNPKIRTFASGEDRKQKTFKIKGPIKINDRVEFEGLIPGLKYRLETRLVDKKTGDFIEDRQGNSVIEKEFIADQGSGFVDISIEFDSSGMEDCDLVVFERLYQGDNLIVSHEDINDKDQSLSFEKPKIPKKPDNPPSGDHIELNILFALVTLGLLYGLGLRKKRA